MVQISKLDKELKLLHLHSLSDALQRDPDLAHIPESAIPQTIQTLFVATGCDYVSFFSGLGKSNFLKVFMEHAKFILRDHPEAFSTSFTSSTLQQQAEATQLAFIRLVGCAYFKKHSNAFFGKTPQSLFNASASYSPTEQHIQWLNQLRQGIWDRITQESEQIPSFTALQLHWQRSCWIINMWQQALSNEMTLANMHGNGWAKEGDGGLQIVWETEDRKREVNDRVFLLLKGCGCKSGCHNKKCGCRRRGMACGPGCRCCDCGNLDTTQMDNRE
jgi:hypothetical protein